ncbi:hypothetical protein ABWH96_00565 [Marivirga tractuosa]|uniref:hypothetical protein n=1 Tax=Marivirga tractuosa TaxID=1006 RepID=UPI0035CF4B91
MKVNLHHIIFLSCIFLLFGCDSEDDLSPASPSYIKIIEGNGADDPIAIRTLSDGTLLIVSNSVSFEQGDQIRKIRILKLNLNGNIINEQFLPESNQNWAARDVLVMQSGDILLASTIQNSIGADTSLLFYKINNNLDSIGTSTYNNEAAYTLFGIEEDDDGLLFIAQESKGSDSYPIIGELNSDNLALKRDVKEAKKYDESPSTKVYRNEAGEYVWAYNRTRSYLTRVQPNLLLVNDQEINLGNSGDTKAEKLLMREGNPIVFGEVKINQRDQIFYYNQNSGNSFVFGSSANTLLNNVQMTPDGFLVTGYQDLQIEGSENRQRNFFLSRRNENGGEIFSKTFGTDDNQELTDAVFHNGSIISIGKTVFDGENTLVLIKTDAFGQLKN